jgi:protein gp37
LESEWFDDGPVLPVEFARHSSLDRVTLVLVAGVEPVPTLWATLRVSTVSEALEALRRREGTIRRFIGSFERGGASTDGPGATQVADWCQRKGLSGAVWTALGPRWGGEDGAMPTVDAVIAFLRQQGGSSKAAEYVRRAPPQVATRFRAEIEAALDWARS